MAQKRAVKKSGKRTKPSSNPLKRSGKSKPTKKAVGVKKKAARKAVKRPPRGAKQARKTATARRTGVAKKAAGPLPKKMTAQKKRAARSSPKPASDVGVRERQSTGPAVPLVVGEAPDANPVQAGGGEVSA